MVQRWMLVLALAASACGAVEGDDFATSESSLESHERDLAPNGRGGGLAREHATDALAKAAGGPTAGNGITFHGGPVMLGTVNVYYVWYGNWAGNTATGILGDLASGIGGTPYYAINTTYTDAAGARVSNAVQFAGSTIDAYSRGKSLRTADVQAIVASAISSKRLPADANGVYFVLTSADVTEGGFCSSYCGWHTHATIAATDVKFAFVGDASRCPASCAAQSAASPNGNVGADAMASIVAHELEEAVTDPDLNAWFDKRGQENADKCAWSFGTTYTFANGARANMRFNGRDWLIQRNWVNAAGGFCATEYGAVAAGP